MSNTEHNGENHYNWINDTISKYKYEVIVIQNEHINGISLAVCETGPKTIQLQLQKLSLRTVYQTSHGTV